MSEPTLAVCKCNNCSGNLEFEVEHDGETIQCPHCKMDTVLYSNPIQEKTAKIIRKTFYKSGGIESRLSETGRTLFILSLISGIYCIYFGLFVGIAVMVCGYVNWTIFKAIAEIIRLLKKSNGLPFSGEISQSNNPYQKLFCSACEAEVPFEKSMCTKCSATFVNANLPP
jgi:hypothetical protein